jgi:tetratricopeptide (TPR) repeat protein
MSSEVFLDEENLPICPLDAIMPAPDGGPEVRAAYPLPALRVLDEEEMRTFRTVILENPYLRVTLVPGLGGRILSIWDRRTSREILQRHPSLRPQQGSPRGAWLREGVVLRITDEERPNSLGNVAVQIAPSQEEDAPAEVWLGEASFGPSFNLLVSLPPDRAELLLEARIFNRGDAPVPYNGGLSLYLGEGDAGGRSFYSRERDCGLAVFEEEGAFDGLAYMGGHLLVRRFASPRWLAPRQLDAWAVRLVPLSGLGGLTSASGEAAVAIEGTSLRVQTVAPRMNHKIVVRTQDGQTLEAPADLYPERPFAAELPSPIEALVLLDPAREEIIRADAASSTESLGPPAERELPARIEALGTDEPYEQLRRRTFDLPVRASAWERLGRLALAQGRTDDAAHAFEQSLLFNAEDHLAWWAKGMAGRIGGGDEERPEIANAHFLAPLEPALRAEAFLGQSAAMGREANPLLDPLEETPEDLVEVAALLVHWRLFDQATRWIDEALRHRDLAMLRYLQAFTYLTGSRMDAEAAEHLAAARRLEFGPPFPWRPIELEALAALQNRFPEDPMLNRYAHLAQVFGGNGSPTP